MRDRCGKAARGVLGPICSRGTEIFKWDINFTVGKKFSSVTEFVLLELFLFGRTGILRGGTEMGAKF